MISKERMRELIAKANAKRASTNTINSPEPTTQPKAYSIQNQYGELITLNNKQCEIVDLAKSRKSCVLLGSAGTGKTTGTKATVQEICTLPTTGQLDCFDHKKLPNTGVPIIGTSFTRTAVANLRKAMPANMKANCISIHALLEYAPDKTVTIDEEGNETLTIMFKPQRNEHNPLSDSIEVIIIDEASMVEIEPLFRNLLDAIQHEVQFIFIGDIEQLPPVFGSSILGYAMINLPVVQLTEVYRNAGPIIALAQRILSGKPLSHLLFERDYHVENEVIFKPWKKSVDAEVACNAAARMAIALHENNEFDLYNDMILCPFNKAFGTIELNKRIAYHLSKEREAKTYEILTGFDSMYFAVGDRIMYNKEIGVITNIESNMKYTGKLPQLPNIYLNRHGINDKKPEEGTAPKKSSLDDVDELLASMVAGTIDEAKRQASHTITVEINQGGDEPITHELSGSGEVKNLLLAYALTAHKSQGSEWDKVLVTLHKSHNSMLTREILYTMITRAKHKLVVIGEKDTFITGITKQSIKGESLEEKANYFKGKALNSDTTWMNRAWR